MTTDHFATLGKPRRPWLEPEDLKQTFLSLSAELHPDRLHQQGAQAKQGAHSHYLEIHAAYECLREPKTRLRHLLELERGTRPSEIENVPPSLLDFFLQVSQTTRKVDAWIKERAGVDSPLLKAAHFSRGSEHDTELAELMNRLQVRRQALENELRELDAAWMASRADTASQSEEFKKAPASKSADVSSLQGHQNFPRPASWGDTAGSDPGATNKAVSAGHDALLVRLEEMYRLFSYFARWSSQISERQFQILNAQPGS